MQMTPEECLAHVGEMVPPAMMDYVTNEVLKHSRYIFTTRKGKHQYGYCTHCRHRFQTSGVRHNATAVCPSCGSECQVKAGGLKRGSMVDHALVTHWRKSAVDPDLLVAVGAYVYRDYRKDYRDVQTVVRPESLCMFRAGDGGIRFLLAWKGAWRQTQSVRCYYYKEKYGDLNTSYSREHLAAAVAGTPFRYSTWEQYDHGDMTMFFDLYARYPSIEYLTKLGFSDLVVTKLQSGRTYGAINWRGRSPMTVLRLTKPELKAVASSDAKLTFPILKLLQQGKRDGSDFSVAEATRIADSAWFNIDYLLKAGERTKLRRIITYLDKQSADQGCHQAGNPYTTLSSALQAWKDYLEDCAYLKMNLAAERVLFPRSLYLSHQQTIARRRGVEVEVIRQAQEEAAARRAARDRELDTEIKKQAKRLQKLCFDRGDLQLRPIASHEELVAEGNSLDHCVATYAEQYAAGQTGLFALRRTSEPDKPFYTVEVRRGVITQCYGRHNCKATEEVQAFMNAFTAEKLATKAEQEVAN